jgi:hypothetical protein
MEVSRMSLRLSILVASAALCLVGRASAQDTPTPAQHGPDCTCRVEGRSIAVGATACLRTAEGPRASPNAPWC